MTPIKMSQFAGMNEHSFLYSFSYFLDAMVELELEHIELWTGSPHLYIEDATLSQIHQLRRDIDSRNLKVICYTPEQCIYPVNIAAKEPYIRQKSIEFFLKNLEVAAELEVPMFQIVPGWGYYNEPVEEAWARSRDSLEQISQKAASLGILLVLKALDKHGTNLIHDSRDLKKMLNKINSTSLKAIIDTCPMQVEGESFEDCFGELGQDLRHVHFIDRGHCAWGMEIFP